MKRIFISSIPLESNFVLKKQPIKCINLQLREDDGLIFPISRLIEAVMEPGDEALVITVRQKNAPEDKNFRNFKDEVAALGFPYQLVDITMPENQLQTDLAGAFRSICKAIQPNCPLYADSTFGTKTWALLLSAAIQYAESIKGCEIRQVIYQEQKRSAGVAVSTSIYEISTIFQIQEVVRVLAASGGSIEEKDALLDALLGL